jgi:hypothetical protein
MPGFCGSRSSSWFPRRFTSQTVGSLMLGHYQAAVERERIDLSPS